MTQSRMTFVDAIGMSRQAVADTSATVGVRVSSVVYTSLTATRTLTLPAANTYPQDMPLVIADESGSCAPGKAITIAANTNDTIFGVASINLTRSRQRVLLFSDGTSQWTVSGLVDEVLNNLLASGPLAGVIRSDVTQTLSRSAMALARNNIGAGGYGSVVSAATTLLASSINRFIYFQGTSYTVTLPSAATFVAGDYFTFSNVGTGTVTLQIPSGDSGRNFYYGSNSVATTYALRSGQTIQITFDGSNWITSQRAPSPDTTPAVDIAQSFTASQRLTLRQNLLLDGAAVIGINASYVCTAAQSQMFFVLYGGSTVDLPAIATTAQGDTFRFMNFSNSAITIRVNQSTDQGQSTPTIGVPNQTSAQSFILLAYQGVKIKSNGSNWYIEAVLPGFNTIQLGGGTGQGNNKIYMGWNGNNKILAQVDGVNQGGIWTDYLGGASFATNGYQRLPSGITIQWGNNTPSGGDQQISFPVAFSATPWSVTTAAEAGGASNTVYTGCVDNVYATNFILRGRYAVNGGTVGQAAIATRWMAIGPT